MRLVKTSKILLKVIRIISWHRNVPCKMKWIYIQTMVSGLVCVQLHWEQFRLKEDCKSASFDTTWLRLVWHFQNMFLVLVGKKLAKKQSYDSFKAKRCTRTEYFGILFCITYMGMSGLSLHIESTNSMTDGQLVELSVSQTMSISARAGSIPVS